MANFTRVKPSGWALNEALTSAQMNALDIDHTKAPNADDGSTHTPAAPIIINGQGIEVGGASGGITLTETTGAPSRVQLTSRNVVRNQSLAGMPDGASFTDWGFGGGGFDPAWKQLTIPGAAVPLFLFLDNLADGNELDEVIVSIEPGTGHGGLPATLPQITLQSIEQSTNVVNTHGSAAVDPSASVGAYELVHDITLVLTPLLIDLANRRYFIKYEGEAGANSVVNKIVRNLRTDHDMVTVPEH